MSAREALIHELEQQPDAVAQKLLDYLHALSPQSASMGGSSANGERHFAGYWSRFYGAFDGEQWDEPAELPNESREEW